MARGRALLAGVPHGVVLERAADAALFLLLPATARPRVVRHAGTGGLDATELALERSDPEWLAAVARSRSSVRASSSV